MSASPPLLRRLGVELPLFQAPMAGVATPALAAAVSNAGGLGALGIGASTLDAARRQIRETRALTGRPFNVNVFCHAPATRNAQAEAAWIAHLAPLFAEVQGQPPAELHEIYRSFVGDDAALAMLLEERPAVVSFHFGLPSHASIAALRDAGIVTFASATNVAEARAIEAAGVDAIVAQGYEAGGHRGMFDPQAPDEQWSTAVLVRVLLDQVSLPIIAAGGIMDGAGIRAALALGATAAQLGTAFILCPESSATPGHRAHLRGARANATRMTTALSGRPARGIVNRLIERGAEAGAPAPCGYPMAYDVAKQLHAQAAAQGTVEFGAHWAGQGAPLARELPAGELVRALAHSAFAPDTFTRLASTGAVDA